MKTLIYIRVSSEGQNTARQVEALTDWAIKTGSTETETVIDKISGSIPAMQRGLKNALNGFERVVVQDLDRLGRDTIDILTTIKKFTEKGINLTVTSLGMDTLQPDGKENAAFKVILSVMATLAELERGKIRERQAQGIAIAKKQGKYKTVGRKEGSVETKEQTLSKYKHVVKALKDGLSLRKTAKLCDVSVNTVQKVKEALQ